jgi:hypothetical protein
LQLERQADEDAVCAILGVEAMLTALVRHPSDQEVLCKRLLSHAQGCMHDEGCSEDRLDRLLIACVRCAPQHMLAMVHHQQAVVALHSGNLELALEASLKEKECIGIGQKCPKVDVGRVEIASQYSPTHGQNKQHAAGHNQQLACEILQLKIFMQVCCHARKSLVPLSVPGHWLFDESSKCI